MLLQRHQVSSSDVTRVFAQQSTLSKAEINEFFENFVTESRAISFCQENSTVAARLERAVSFFRVEIRVGKILEI